MLDSRKYSILKVYGKIKTYTRYLNYVIYNNDFIGGAFSKVMRGVVLQGINFFN